MKTKLLVFVTFFLAACSTTKPADSTGNAALDSDNPRKQESYYQMTEQSLPTDPHSVAIHQILAAMNVPKVARMAMFKKIEEDDGAASMPPQFLECLSNQMTDNRIYNLLIPVYKTALSEESASKLAEFYQSPTGEKFITYLKVEMGESMPLPDISPEDVMVLNQYKPYFENMKSPGLQEKARSAGYELGVKIGMHCALQGGLNDE